MNLRIVSGALVALFAFLQPANAAGTVPGFSLTPQFDNTGKIMPGCQLFVIQAGTTSTPQNAYQDSALTQLQPNPMLCDATGRTPQWFTADGNVKIRLTNKNGLQVFSLDNLLVVGPSGGGGGGGGGTIDPTTIAATGDVKAAYGTAIISGWVRANARTIGSASSGATERANSDTAALFAYLWNADPNLAVSTGRGASASADFSANKTITLPDGRGRGIAGLDDMGNTDAARLSGSALTSCRTTLGCAGGESTHAMAVSEMAAHRHGVALVDPGHVHPGGEASNKSGFAGGNPSTLWFGNPASNTGSAVTGMQVTDGSGNTNLTAITGGGTPFNLVKPTILMTLYVKL